MLIVTGATGLLGNTSVRRALARGIEVTTLVRETSATRPLDGLAIRRIAVDLTRDDLCSIISKGVIVARAAALAPPGSNDFCHGEHVADGVIAAGLRGPSGSRYMLGGEALTYAEAFALMHRVAGRAPRVLNVPAWLVRPLGHVGDGLGVLTRGEPALSSARAAIACLPHHFSSARASHDLGYHHRPAKIAMRDAWAWFTSNGYA